MVINHSSSALLPLDLTRQALPIKWVGQSESVSLP